MRRGHLAGSRRIIVGQEVGRSLGKRHIFAENKAGSLVLRRGFQISPNERFVVAEDVVTRGGRVQETIDTVRQDGGVVTGVEVVVDRSGGTRPDFGCPFISLVAMGVATFSADHLSPNWPPFRRRNPRVADFRLAGRKSLLSFLMAGAKTCNWFNNGESHLIGLRGWLKQTA